MVIQDLKDFKKLLQLCKMANLKSLSIGGVSIEFNERIVEPKAHRVSYLAGPMADLMSNTAESVKVPSPNIQVDGPTDEELLMWSAGSTEPIGQ